MIPNSSTKLYINGTDTQYLYANTKITMSDVINFLTYIKTNVTSINLSRAFVSCSKLAFGLTEAVDGTCTYNTTTYNNFVSALSNFKTGKSVNVSYMFLSTSFNFLDNTLVKLFKNGGALTESVRDTTDNVLYVSSDFLNGQDEDGNIINGDVTSLSLSGWIATVGANGTGYGKVKFYKKDGTKFKVIKQVNLKEILNNGVLNTVTSLSPYTDASISVICTGGGFPETVKKIDTFCCNSTKFNYTDFEQIFDGLSDCYV